MNSAIRNVKLCMLPMFTASLVLACLAAPARATDYFFNIKGAGEIVDNRPSDDRKVYFSAGYYQLGQDQESGWTGRDLPGLQHFSIKPTPAPGWRFKQWEGHEWRDNCGFFGCGIIVDRLKCVGAGDDDILVSHGDNNTSCDFQVDIGRWHALKAVFEDVRWPTAEIFYVDGDTISGQRVHPSTWVRWHFRETSNPLEGARFQCNIAGEGWHECSSGTSYSNAVRPPGEYEFKVRPYDKWSEGPHDQRDQNIRPVYTTKWVVDRVAPNTRIDAAPAGRSSSRTASFSFAAEHGDGGVGETFKCSLDAQPWEACDAGVSYAVEHGDHQLQVKAADSVGNEDLSPAVHTWTVDVVGPPASITTGPSAQSLSGSAFATFGFASPERVEGFRCGLDGAALETCSGPAATHRVGPLGNGVHTFRVAAVDDLGNVGPPATRSWAIAARPADTTILSGPAERSVVGESNTEFAFTADEADAVAECRVDGAAFGSCTGPGATHRVGGLANGPHTFEVRAIDADANVEPEAARRRWTVNVATFRLGPTRLQGRWKQSVLRPSSTVRLRGDFVSVEPATVTMTLQNRRVPAARMVTTMRVVPGTFDRVLELPVSALRGPGLLVPGGYDLVLSGITAGGVGISARQATRLANPKGGVIMSTKIRATARSLSVKFRWAPEGLPKGKPRAVWYAPGGRRVARHDLRAPRGTTMIAAARNGRLQRGRWRCVVSVGATHVKTVHIKVA